MKKDNLQPNSGIPQSTEEVQRLTGEQESNKPDTSTPHLNKYLKCSQCKEVKTEQELINFAENILKLLKDDDIV